MSGPRWTTVRVQSTDRTAVIGVLFQNGAEAIQETSDAVVTHLRHADAGALTTALLRADGHAKVAFEPTPDVDWTSAWRSRLTAHRVGRLVVTPPWLAEQFTAQERIVIEPAMAFGTGDHESTRGVLRLMEHVVRREDLVADLGAGSAVLAIAAARLGARRVVAIEIDPDAIENAEGNVLSNGVEDRVTIVEGDAAALLPLVAPVRVVLANIVSSALISLLEVIRASLTPDGSAILAGILVDEREMMEDVLRRGGWRIERTETENAWWSVAIARS